MPFVGVQAHLCLQSLGAYQFVRFEVRAPRDSSDNLFLMQDFSSPPPLPSGEPPPVWRWFVIYTIALGIVYLALAAFGVVALLIDPSKLDMQRGEARLMGVVFVGLGLIFALPFLAAPYLPRKSWVWIYDLVLICLGMTSACCIPACIPLLIHWLKPETKAFFNR